MKLSNTNEICLFLCNWEVESMTKTIYQLLIIILLLTLKLP